MIDSDPWRISFLLRKASMHSIFFGHFWISLMFCTISPFHEERRGFRAICKNDRERKTMTFPLSKLQAFSLNLLGGGGEACLHASN